MTTRQKILNLLLGFAGLIVLGLILWAVYSALFSHLAATNNASATSQPTGPADAAAPDAAPDPASAEAHLMTVEEDLQKAADDMSRASIAGKGGYTEKSRIDIGNALTLVNQSIDFATTHPEIDKLPTPLDGEELPDPPGGAANVAPRLREALTQIQAAHDELDRTPGGDINGTRDSLNAILEKTAEDLASGINFAMGNVGKAGTVNMGTATLNGATFQITIDPQNTATIQTNGDLQTGSLQIITTPDTQPAAAK
jgi:hypothetical protein